MYVYIIAEYKSEIFLKNKKSNHAVYPTQSSLYIRYIFLNTGSEAQSSIPILINSFQMCTLLYTVLGMNSPS